MITAQLLREFITRRDQHKGAGAIVGVFFILLMTVNMLSFTLTVSLYNSTRDLNPEKCQEPYHLATLYSVWVFPFVILGVFVCCSSLLSDMDNLYLICGGCIMNIFISLWSIVIYSILVSARNDVSEDCAIYWNTLDERVLIFLDFSYFGLIVSGFGFLMNAFTGCYLFTENRE
jgi:hypothetical protein